MESFEIRRTWLAHTSATKFHQSFLIKSAGNPALNFVTVFNFGSMPADPFVRPIMKGQIQVKDGSRYESQIKKKRKEGYVSVYSHGERSDRFDSREALVSELRVLFGAVKADQIILQMFGTMNWDLEDGDFVSGLGPSDEPDNTVIEEIERPALWGSW